MVPEAVNLQEIIHPSQCSYNISQFVGIFFYLQVFTFNLIHILTDSHDKRGSTCIS